MFEEFEVIMIPCELRQRRREHETRSEFDGNRLCRFKFRWMQLSNASRMHFASYWRTFSFATSARSAIRFQNFDNNRQEDSASSSRNSTVSNKTKQIQAVKKKKTTSGNFVIQKCNSASLRFDTSHNLIISD